MTEAINDSSSATTFNGQPIAIVEREGVRYTLLGTAHVSRASVDAVRAAIASGDYDQVAIELDTQRLQALAHPEALAKLDLVKVLREGKTALFAANLALAGYQRRLAEKLGIEPGAELKVAAVEAEARQLPLHLIDRDVGITFRRAMRSLGWWGRAKISAGLVAGMVTGEEVDEAEIERLKEGDILESAFGEFASQTPALYETIIAERDRYMAARLRATTAGATHVLAVVGAGHLQGLARHLRDETDAPAGIIEHLDFVPKKSSIPWFALVLAAFLLAGLTWGIAHGGLKVGADVLLQWVLVTAGLTAVGCAAAGGHPLSILASAAVAPFKPFRPTIPSGAVGALIEVRMRQPTHDDFLALRDDVRTVRGWYHNRVARVLLVFMLTCLGTMIGEWIGIVRILGRLAT